MGKKKRREKQTPKEPKPEHKGKEPTNNWRKILDGTVHSISSGWVQNLLIGLVLLLLGPAIGTLMNDKRIVILSAALGICLLVIIVAIIMVRQISTSSQAPENQESSQDQKRPFDPFSVEIELSMLSTARGFFGNRFYVAYLSAYGKTVSPADVTMFVKIVNLQSVPSMIERFRISMKLGNGEWTRLINLPLRGNSIFWVGPEGLKKARQIDTSNGLDVMLSDKNTQPHEPVRGWLYLETPADYSAPTGTLVQYRLEIEDATGLKYEYTSSLSPSTNGPTLPGGSDQLQSIPWRVLPGGYQDINSFHLRHYNDPIK